LYLWLCFWCNIHQTCIHMSSTFATTQPKRMMLWMEIFLYWYFMGVWVSSYATVGRCLSGCGCTVIWGEIVRSWFKAWC
jgi:hypothetical protein